MDEKVWCYGCLFCRIGSEATIVDYSKQRMTGIETIATACTCYKTVAGKVVEKQLQLLPGYIFFRTKIEMPRSQLTRITNVFKLLEYDSLSGRLTGRNKEFAEFLFNNELFQAPHIPFIESRIHFNDGFLYRHDNDVLRMNRRKKTVEVQLDIDRLTFGISYRE